jgi:hypothetical protein
MRGSSNNGGYGRSQSWHMDLLYFFIRKKGTLKLIVLNGRRIIKIVITIIIVIGRRITTRKSINTNRNTEGFYRRKYSIGIYRGNYRGKKN